MIIYGILMFVYLLLVILLIAIVLIQEPKSAGLGGMFGGGAETVFGAKGAATFFTKLTAGLGAAYMVLSLILSILNRPAVGGSAIERAIQKDEVLKKLNIPTQPARPSQPSQPVPENPQPAGGQQ